MRYFDGSLRKWRVEFYYVINRLCVYFCEIDAHTSEEATAAFNSFFGANAAIASMEEIKI
jgi:hypothetical protein